jgi:hypothetical protein
MAGVEPRTAAVALCTSLCIGGAIAQPATPLQFRHAVAMPGCTQEDARALEIYLTPQPFGGDLPAPQPNVRIEVEWSVWSSLLGRPLVLVPLSRAGLDRAALRVRASMQSSTGALHWLSGSLTLTAVDVGRRVDATYDFVGGNGSRWRGTITAQWMQSDRPCG